MREMTQKLLLALALAAVVVIAVAAAANVQVSPEIYELWEDEDMPVMTPVLGMQLHLPLGTYVLTLGVALVMLIWIFTRKEPKLHLATLVMILCGGVMIAVGKWPFERLDWDADTHRMWVYAFSTWETYTLTDYLSMFSTWFFAYIPYSLGLLLGKLLGLAESWALRLTFVGGVCAYAAICTAAVKVTPRYKLTFMIMSVLPTCLFQAGNISYDSMVTAGVLLSLALLVREMDAPQKRLSRGTALSMTLAMTMGTLAKPAYSLLLLLYWMLPESKFGSKKRLWIFRLFVLVLLVMCLYSCLLGMYDEQLGGDERLEDTDSAGQIQFILSNPLLFLATMGKFFVKDIPQFFTEAASLWAYWGHGKPVALIMLALLWILCPLYCVNEKRAAPLNGKKRVAFFVIGIIPVLVLMVTQYIISSPVGHDTIVGVQPRYVIPLMPLVSMAFMLPHKLRRRTEPAARWIALAAGLIALACVYADGWRIVMERMQGVMLG